MEELSDAKNTVPNTEGNLVVRRGVTNRISVAKGIANGNGNKGIRGNSSHSKRRYSMIGVFSFLIFFYLQQLVFVFTAAGLFVPDLFHAAFFTVALLLFVRKVPFYKPAHAIMQVYRGADGGAQVKKGQY